MSKKPWYPFYPADFRSSPKVQTLTLEQEACLRRLLDIQWLSDDCTIPDNMQMHCTWTANAMQVECNRDAVLQFFPIIEDGKRANLRLRELFLKASDTSRERKKAAETRWNKPKTKRKKKADAIAYDLQCDPDSYSDSDSNSNNTPLPPKGEMAAQFETFWKAYPKKKAIADAKKAWLKLNPDTVLQKKILKAVQDQCKTEDWKKEDGKYIPYPASWLNGSRWEDSTEIQNEEPLELKKPSWWHRQWKEYTEAIENPDTPDHIKKQALELRENMRFIS